MVETEILEKERKWPNMLLNLADEVYITDDNPRYENPKKIRDQISFYCKKAFVIANRKNAIKESNKKTRKI